MELPDHIRNTPSLAAHFDPVGIPILPEEFILDYLGEGAANIVYKMQICIGPRPITPVDEYGRKAPGVFQTRPYWHEFFENKLLRCRKNLPTTAPVIESLSQWRRLFYPLFHEHNLIQQELVHLPKSQLEYLNKSLAHWEKYNRPIGARHTINMGAFTRPTKREGIFLANDPFGLLITDMSAHGDDCYIELKPKWLVQSPSAPKGAIRCRQCALNARRNAEKEEGHKYHHDICPLDLISTDPKILREVAALMVYSNDMERATLRMTEWLLDNPLLRRLAYYQQINDRVGPIEGDVTDERFLIAMTLRDCSLYFRFPLHDNGTEIEARIGDLDLKLPSKAQYWRETEEALINGGYYMGTEKRPQPLSCNLTPDRYTNPRAYVAPPINPLTYGG